MREEPSAQGTEGYGRSTDGMLLFKNGEVVWFDLEEVQRAIDALPKKGESFFDKHCLAICGDGKGGYDCSKCTLGACPIADQ